MDLHLRHLQRKIFELFQHAEPTDLPSQSLLFEYYLAHYLGSHQHIYASVWRDIAPNEKLLRNLFLTDKGVDVISHDFAHAYQCKLYGPNTTISYSKLATFHLFLSNFAESARPDLTLCRLATSPVCAQLKHIIQIGNMREIAIPFPTFWADCQHLAATYVPEEADMQSNAYELYPYQREALDVVQQAYQNDQNCILHLPTGCGKTLTILDLLLSRQRERILVMVPTLTLVDQWISEAIFRGIPEESLFAVDCEHTQNVLSDDILPEKKLVVCVFNSIEKVLPFMDWFESVVMDEAHNLFPPHMYTHSIQVNENGQDVEEDEGVLLQDDDDDEEKHEDEEEEEDEKKQSEEVESKESKESRERKRYKASKTFMQLLIDYVHHHTNSILLSATIRPLPNMGYYHLPLRHAIDQGYLADYQVMFPVFSSDPTDTNVVRYLIQRGETHCIVFTASIVDCERITEIFNTILPGCAGAVHSEIGAAQRAYLLDAFERGTIRFLVNVRVLVEGFDSKVCSSVVFFHMPSNQTFTIQAIGRALRKRLGKNVATIYFPFNREDDQTAITQFLRQMAGQDERIMHDYRERRLGLYLNIEAVADTVEDPVAEPAIAQEVHLRFEKLLNSMEVLDANTYSLQKTRHYLEWTEEHGRRPRRVKPSSPEKVIELAHARWMIRLKMLKKLGRLSQEIDHMMTERLGAHWWSNVDLEAHAMEKARAYVEWSQVHRRPPRRVLAQQHKREVATEAQRLENTLASWMQDAKKVRKGRVPNHEFYPSVDRFLTERIGPNWFVDRNAPSEERSLVYVEWMRAHNHQRPKLVLSKQKDRFLAPPDQRVEHALAEWFQCMKKKHHQQTISPQVEEVLTKAIGDRWFE